MIGHLRCGHVSGHADQAWAIGAVVYASRWPLNRNGTEKCMSFQATGSQMGDLDYAAKHARSGLVEATTRAIGRGVSQVHLST